MYLYIYIYIYNIHNIVHISSNMRVWRIYLEIASLAASWRIVLCIFFFAHMDQNAWKLTTATGYGLPEWKKGGGGMNKIETSDVIGSVFYLHELIAYQWILALFFLSYLLWHPEKMTNKKLIYPARVWGKAVKCKTMWASTNTLSGFFGIKKNCTLTHENDYIATRSTSQCLAACATTGNCWKLCKRKDPENDSW